MKHFILQTKYDSLPISKVILGSTYFGTDLPKSLAFEMLDYYYQQGGRTIDTARSYGQKLPGMVSPSEQVIGQWLAQRGLENEITLLTKGAHPPKENFSVSRVTPTEILRDIQDSLDLLGVDTIDLWFLHRDAPSADVPLVMETLTQAVAEGKIRAFGASNWTLRRMLEANTIAEQRNLLPFEAAQIQWSLAYSAPKDREDSTLVYLEPEEMTDWQRAGIPIIGFGGQGKGFFSQYIEKTPGAVRPKADRFLNAVSCQRSQAVQVLMQRHEATAAQIALAYLVNHPLDGAAIIGSSSLRQLEDSLGAMEMTLSLEEIQSLEWFSKEAL